MEVIQFPSAKGLLDFDGMSIKIDVEQQRESWAATFTSVQTALRFCNLDHVEARKMVLKLIDLDILDETGVRWVESVEYLESIVATLKAALARLEVSEDRALGRRRTTKPKSSIAPALAQALARHKAAQAAIDAAPEGYPDHLNEAEFDAIDELAETPCASDAEFLEKLRYLHAYETRTFGPPTGQHEFSSVVLAVDCHFITVNG
jgi:hypothetical protein